MTLFEPTYSASHALIIGINKYMHAPPLAYAINDARVIASSIIEKFDFSVDKTTLLIDVDATRGNITQKLADLSRCEENDKIFFFFAGHGHTVSGRRGDAGFLVPVDGDVSDLSTLLRWEDILRLSELIPAKHMFFVVDACYGGLALNRKGISAGSARLIKDMLQRYSRQVLTSGKADQPVSDGGGKRNGHSLFTSYFLDALEELKTTGDGIVSANKLMPYVYDAVGNDVISDQTPHYGFVDGDGDFIFNPPDIPSEPDQIENVLIASVAVGSSLEYENVASELKSMLSDPAKRIAMEDYVDQMIKRTLASIGKLSRGNGSFDSRVSAAEEVMGPLAVAAVLLAKWANGEQLRLLYKILQRVAESEKPTQGSTFEIGFSWYPYFYLLYAAGVSCTSQERIDVLHGCLFLNAPIERRFTRTIEQETTILPTAIRGMTSIVDNFKRIPGFEKHITARSDYLYQRLQIIIEDNLFLGKSYQSAFDNFEIFMALTYADLDAGDNLTQIWGPPGRFLWQNRADGQNGPYGVFLRNAERLKENWPPLRAGFFRASYSRFEAIAKDYSESLDRAHF